MKKIIWMMMVGLISICLGGCVQPYQPYAPLATSQPAYGPDGSPVVKIECKQSTADCLQEAGFICTTNGFDVIHGESLGLGSVTNSSSSASVVAITKDYAVGSSDSQSHSYNIQDHYIIIRCKNDSDTIANYNKLKQWRDKQEAEHHADWVQSKGRDKQEAEHHAAGTSYSH